MAVLKDQRSLRNLLEAFKELAAAVDSQTADVEVATFSRAFSLIPPSFFCFGIAGKFAEIDLVAKVNDIAEASKSISTT